VLTGDRDRQARFVDWLLQEIAICGRHPWPDFVERPPVDAFDTLYLGGGTPSLLAPPQLARILEAVAAALPMAAPTWIGLEVNPEDVSPQRVAVWRRAGVRFLSIGVQSFDSRALAFLGRRHDARQSRESVAVALAEGFETVSIDLIYGWPDQTVADWTAELEAAFELRPHHLSCYQLTVEARTPFGFRRQRGELTELDPEQQADHFLCTHRFLGARGYSAYEVSNFAAEHRHRSRHNRKYWAHTPFLGLGPSAHSFAGRCRWWNERKIRPWQARLQNGDRPIEDREQLATSQLCLERLLLGLRTPEGVDFKVMPDGRGVPLWRVNQPLIEQLVERGWLVAEDLRIEPTLAGMALAESIVRDFTIPPD
jgi:oxygen-independent coproporphyrinogen-3 oxidase